MSKLKELLNVYIADPNNDIYNINLAEYYYDIGQYAAALSFYLRCAERSYTKELQYYCLVMMGRCLEHTQNRHSLAKSCYHHAINVCPLRPEAYYYLSRSYEWTQEWILSYTTASTGLTIGTESLNPLYSNKIEYKGEYMLLFQKAVAAWWWGKTRESRALLHLLKNSYYQQMDQAHIDAVQRNIVSLGSGEVFIYYNSDNYSKLRYKFANSDQILRNYSQVFQDIFILSIFNGKKNGTYLEIGSADPSYGNNTYLLEKNYGWTGLGIEYNEKFINNYKAVRKNEILLADALTVNYTEILQQVTDTNTVDYLQLDCEPAETTYNILLKIPFDKYKFGVITYEHDYYADITQSCREKSRKYLTDKGYLLVVNDICSDKEKRCSFEDWWVHPDLVDKTILNLMIDNDLNISKNAEEYIYSFNHQYTDTKPVELRPIWHINKAKNKRLFVVDNFYVNPDSIREFALKQEFEDGGFGRGYIGHRTAKQFLFPGLKKSFEAILGEKITVWEQHNMNGRFQYSTEGEALVYHCDDQRWAGMLFLTPNAPYEAGTSFWSLKNTDIRDKYHPDILRAFRGQGAQNLDKTIFEPVDRIGNVYNRLVLFDSGLLHSASEYFGWTKENGRLWHMFFFD